MKIMILRAPMAAFPMERKCHKMRIRIPMGLWKLNEMPFRFLLIIIKRSNGKYVDVLKT